MMPFATFRDRVHYDLVGVLSMDAFDDLPPNEHPRSLFPDACSVIVLGSRIRRGEFRSMEEGSLWHTPGRWLTQFDGLLRSIEAEGYECVPYAPQDAPRMPRRPVRDGLCTPNTVRLSVEYAAVAAGLGEIGYHGMFMSARFGIRQRLGMVLTDMPIAAGPGGPPPQICDRCMACVQHCPLQAISADEHVTVACNGRTMPLGRIAADACRNCPNGVSGDSTYFAGADELHVQIENNQIKGDRSARYARGSLPNRLAAACGRACIAHFENTHDTGYELPFRMRPPWGFRPDEPQPTAVQTGSATAAAANEPGNGRAGAAPRRTARPRLTSEMVRQTAVQAGADLCGIASVTRFDGAPPETHPNSLFPDAKSVIVYASRILKGCYKGIQEGTDWSTYWIYGYGSGIYSSLGSATGAIAALLDEHGYEAVVSPGGHTLRDEAPPARAPLGAGRLPPCVMLHMRLSAALAGLGELGWSKVFLSPQFGPRQRFDILLTDAELEPDPLFRGEICDRCMACVRTCPGHALGGERKAITVENREFAWGDVDCGKCKVTHWGLNPEASPFVRKDLPGMNMDVEKTAFTWYEAYRLGFALSERVDYLKLIANGSSEHGQGGRPGSVCGAIGCIQNCNAHLEAKGVLEGGSKGEVN